MTFSQTKKSPLAQVGLAIASLALSALPVSLSLPVRAAENNLVATKQRARTLEELRSGIKPRPNQPEPSAQSQIPNEPAEDPINIRPRVGTSNPMEVQPTRPSVPDWGPTIDPQMLAIIEQLRAYEAPPYPELTAAQAREAPNATSAVEGILSKTGRPPIAPAVDIEHKLIPNPNGPEVLVRTYTPTRGNGPFPVIVYYHGGGWVIANLDTYETSAKELATRTNAIVISVAYRQAPEHKFPAAHEDSFAVYEWATENVAEIGGDPTRIALAGESAGGNLAVAVALMAKERGVELPEHILSVYPIADGDTESSSYDQYANAFPLNRPLMEWFFGLYLNNPSEAENPLISLTSADLSELPPTTIINAEIDPLRAEGENLAAQMEAAGVDVVQMTYPGVTHEFFGMSAILEQAVAAQEMAAERLRTAFGTE